MNSYPPMNGTTAAFDYSQFHNAETCDVVVFPGPTSLYIGCNACKVVVNLEAVTQKLDPLGAKIPRSAVNVDTSNPGPGG